jgi:hypothetical protein
LGKGLGLNRGALAPAAVVDNVPKFANTSVLISSIEKAPPILHLDGFMKWKINKFFKNLLFRHYGVTIKKILRTLK